MLGKKKSIETKREHEKEVVELMIRLYCKGNRHQIEDGSESSLCVKCEDLLQYANMRVDKCPFMETKTFCNNCRVHCYKPDYRAQIKDVMRYSGPRLLLHHPIMVIRHMYYDIKEKRNTKKQNNA